MATIPNMDELPALYAAALEKSARWNRLYPALVEEYGGEYVAIHDEQVIAASSNMDELDDAITASGLAVKDLLIDFVSRPGVRFAL